MEGLGGREGVVTGMVCKMKKRLVSLNSVLPGFVGILGIPGQAFGFTASTLPIWLFSVPHLYFFSCAKPLFKFIMENISAS